MKVHRTEGISLNPTLGHQVIGHIEAGGIERLGPVELTEREKAILLWLYEVYPQGHAREGQRVYDFRHNGFNERGDLLWAPRNR